MLGYILFLVAYLLFLPLTIFNALNLDTIDKNHCEKSIQW